MPLACAHSTHARACSGVCGVPLPQAGAGTLIVENPRRDDLVLRAAFLLFDRQRVLGERHAAHRRHAVRQPQLVRVLRVGVLRCAAGVHVQVDEARQHVHPAGVDLVVRSRRPVGPHRRSGRAGVADGGDAVVFDDDVDGSARRAAGAVDERRSPHDHRLVGTEPFARRAIRGGAQWIALQRGGLVQRLSRVLRPNRDGGHRHERKHNEPSHDAAPAHHETSGAQFTLVTLSSIDNRIILSP